MNRRKVLLMGKSNSGKTSMRSIIFANYIARDTMRLGPTMDVENSHVRFLGNLVLNLWDCGGQDSFMESYFESQKDQIFRNVAVLIYVFDVESHEHKKDLDYFKNALDAIRQNSTNAQIFCLVHKMDLAQKPREQVLAARAAELQKLAESMKLTCFGTSIWDETLYKAWSSIVYSLIPNISILENQLVKFCKLCQADEVVLFEKATFLVISHASPRPHADAHRFEKISNIIKQFKLSCSKGAAQFKSMEVSNQSFTAFIDHFTSNTYIMIIMTKPKIYPAATLLNLQAARSHFDKLVNQYNTHG